MDSVSGSGSSYLAINHPHNILVPVRTPDNESSFSCCQVLGFPDFWSSGLFRVTCWNCETLFGSMWLRGPCEYDREPITREELIKRCWQGKKNKAVADLLGGLRAGMCPVWALPGPGRLPPKCKKCKNRLNAFDRSEARELLVVFDPRNQLKRIDIFQREGPTRRSNAKVQREVPTRWCNEIGIQRMPAPIMPGPGPNLSSIGLPTGCPHEPIC